MRIRLIGCVGIVLLLSVVITAIASSPPGALTVDDPEAWHGLTPKAIERVKNGEIVVAGTQAVVGEKSYGVIAAFMVDVGIQETYRILRENEKQVEYLDVLSKSELINRTDDYDIVEFDVKFLAWVLVYRLRHDWDDEKFRIWWELDPSFDNAVYYVDGFWHLYYVDDDHTLLRYGSNVIFKDYIPSSVQRIVVRHDMPNGLETVRKRINTHGEYKKK